MKVRVMANNIVMQYVVVKVVNLILKEDELKEGKEPKPRDRR